jgi:molybdopterin-guanine dinucleotide biosynthesis protein A
VLRERPLISYPVATMQAILSEVVVVAKPETELPDLGEDVDVWTEPERPLHPLVGIVTALQIADRRPVLVCACDMPLLSSDTIRRLAIDDRGEASIARGDGRWQPLVACYQPTTLNYLRSQLKKHPDRSLQHIVSGLDWVAVDVDPAEMFNVNSPLELTRAADLLAERERRTG